MAYRKIAWGFLSEKNFKYFFPGMNTLLAILMLVFVGYYGLLEDFPR